MRKAAILYKEEEAGVLSQYDDGTFAFRYHDAWMSNDSKPGISLTFPKNKQEYTSKYLFSFFYIMLPE
jgi:serine/threonine-protein kinase HipA